MNYEKLLRILLGAIIVICAFGLAMHFDYLDQTNPTYYGR